MLSNKMNDFDSNRIKLKENIQANKEKIQKFK